MKQILSFVFAACLFSCATIDVYEKHVSLKNHEWDSHMKPAVRFTITDTAALYNIYVVVRHTDAYNYNNLWLNIYTQSPGDSTRKQSLDLRLASNDKGWLGSGMDDIFEQRVRITRQPIELKKAGEYIFSFEQIMREDPLQHITDIGLRIEKEK